MKSYFTLYSFLFLFAFAQAQEKEMTLPIAAKFLRSNTLNETFIVTTENTIIKINQEGKELARFQQPFLGSLEQLDLSNPFKPLAFYPDFQTVVFFDKNLNPLNQLDLKKIGFNTITAVCSYMENQLVIADESQNRLCRIDFNGKILAQTTLVTEDQKDRERVNQLLTKSGNIYAILNNKLFLYFDNQLNLDSQLGSENLYGMEIHNNILYMYQKDDIYYSAVDDFSQEILTLPFEKNKKSKVFISGNRFFEVFEGKIDVYTRE